MKIIDLIEARRNPEMNPRYTVLEELQQYAGRDDVFVQFSDIEKLGIKPRSHFNTPLGIYGYPIDYVLHIANEYSGRVWGKMPFASKRKYAVVFQARGKFLDADKFSRREFDSLCDSLGDFVDDQSFINMVIRNNEYTVFTLKWFLSGLDDVAQKSTNKPGRWKGKFLRYAGYDGILDITGTGSIHPNEPTQAVFFTKQSVRVLDIIENVSSGKRSGEITYENTLNAIAKMFNGAKLLKIIWDMKRQLNNPDAIEEYKESAFDLMDLFEVAKDIATKNVQHRPATEGEIALGATIALGVKTAIKNATKRSLTINRLYTAREGSSIQEVQENVLYFFNSAISMLSDEEMMQHVFIEKTYG